MSKKEEVKKEEDKKKSKEEVKKEEKVTEPVKKKSKEGLYTLIDLVEKSDVSNTLIMMELSRNGYLKQFYVEEQMKKNGLEIKPSMSETKFKKIIGE